MTPIYTTARLCVSEITSDTGQSAVSELLAHVPELLTPAVTENLPPYFHDIQSPSDAREWFERMVSESRLFIVKQNDSDSIIGLLFATTDNEREIHIGYLLGQDYWGQGLASELLKGFISHASEKESWLKLVGGVDRNNQASSKLLLKLGFVERASNENGVVFYEYRLPSHCHNEAKQGSDNSQ